ncbi:5-formyltetrahydrofolate cyclo-ligase [uncultured Alistipes sp.]|uniref:5-formyltetrahydrofolate cyclo-ligase n=1 Tax=uncultured Alistipes sp. TaxID=538949 RepID=UPI002805EC58|nr:5-formyltetrahydrofolate cyclo-ligase [uncultured Alistipes sp.]
MTKNELRKAMRSLNRGLDARARAEASERIVRRMEALEDFAAARTVGLFCALPDEPDLSGAIERWRSSKRLVVPRVEGETMRFFEYDPQTLLPGAFGILEPGPAARLCPPREIDLLFVPGVAFTPQGVRCGRGRGYYDRYLGRADFRAVKIGVCYAHQLVDDLPAEPHDMRVDAVITDR